ncbi:hypothetical protein HPP92_023339 [Vanilla planifolia]|uniref:Uncharacterized protein n=1 Tax=Vanilla planifolia TaxID=51239 RepID=A0A835UI42_VANPL|nr:hypothetical protein HPP92_023339 [Vanilla planifolia]
MKAAAAASHADEYSQDRSQRIRGRQQRESEEISGGGRWRMCGKTVKLPPHPHLSSVSPSLSLLCISFSLFRRYTVFSLLLSHSNSLSSFWGRLI